MDVIIKTFSTKILEKAFWMNIFSNKKVYDSKVSKYFISVDENSCVIQNFHNNTVII